MCLTNHSHFPSIFQRSNCFCHPNERAETCWWYLMMDKDYSWIGHLVDQNWSTWPYLTIGQAIRDHQIIQKFAAQFCRPNALALQPKWVKNGWKMGETLKCKKTSPQNELRPLKLRDSYTSNLKYLKHLWENESTPRDSSHMFTAKHGSFMDIHLLVGGWATPLKNMSSSVGMMKATQYFWENSKFMATIHHQAVFIWFLP